jgi:hypothetical protein
MFAEEMKLARGAVMREAVLTTLVFALCALPAFAQDSDDGAAAAVQRPAPPRAQEAA